MLYYIWLIPSARSCNKSAINIDDGAVNNPDDEISPGDKIDITCNQGYTLRGDDVTCVTQKNNKNEYSGSLPTCERK